MKPQQIKVQSVMFTKFFVNKSDETTCAGCRSAHCDGHSEESMPGLKPLRDPVRTSSRVFVLTMHV